MTAQGEAVSLVVQNLRPGVHLLISESLIVGQNKLERWWMKSFKGVLLMFNKKDWKHFNAFNVPSYGKSVIVGAK